MLNRLALHCTHNSYIEFINRMDQAFAFALFRVGFPYEVIVDFNDNGLWSHDMLLQMSEDEIDTMRSINNRAHNALIGAQANPRRLTLVHVRLLKAYRYTLLIAERVSGPGQLPPGQINRDAIQVGAIRLRELVELRANETLINVPRPPTLRDFNLTRWIPRWRAFVEYLMSLRGAADIPLSYVVRDREVPTAEDHARQYPTVDLRLIAITRLGGSHYEIDNRTVFNEVLAWVQDGPGLVHIQIHTRTRDGRAAALALRQFCEGSARTQTRLQNAKNRLHKLVFSGQSRNFDFDKYLTAFIEIMDEYELIGHTPTPLVQVQEFLDRITDPRFETAKTSYRMHNQIVGVTADLQGAMKAMTDHWSSLNAEKASKQAMRQISEFKSEKKDDEQKQKNKKKPKNKYKNYLPKAQYDALDEEGKKKLWDSRPEEQRPGYKRKASAVTFEDENKKDDGLDTKSAGTQFGRNGNKKKKGNGD